MSRGSAWCLWSCSAARGHPSWLLALFAALIRTSEAETVLELHEKKRPTSSVAMPVLLQMGPARANTFLLPQPSLQSQTTSGYQRQERAHGGEMQDVQGAAQGNGTPASPWVQIPLSPCATPLVPCHLSVCTAPALLGAVCPRALVAATAPVRIVFSFLLSDTGCGHNKTH